MTLSIDIIPALPHWMLTHITITSKIVLSCYGSAVVCGKLEYTDDWVLHNTTLLVPGANVLFVH